MWYFKEIDALIRDGISSARKPFQHDPVGIMAG
jgi:hypothetical protein